MTFAPKKASANTTAPPITPNQMFCWIKRTFGKINAPGKVIPRNNTKGSFSEYK